MGELGEAKQTLNSIRCKSTRTAAMAKGKVVEKSHRVPRVASNTRTAKAARFAKPFADKLLIVDCSHCPLIYT